MKFKNFLNDRGNLIVMVVIVLAVLTLLGTSSLYLIRQQNHVINLQGQREKALYYAEAGYNQYLYYLNQDSNYYNQSASDTFLASSHAYRDGYYRLQILKPTLSNPEVTIKSTGWSAQYPDIKRTIEVAVYKREFSQSVSLMGQMTAPDGSNLYWGDGEQIHGPFHTNGDLRTQGSPVFWDTVSYVNNYIHSNGSPVFKLTGQPVKKTALIFPPTNSQLSRWGATTFGGRTYIGRTCMCLTGTTVKIRNESNGDALEIVTIPSSSVIYVKTSGSKYGDVIISGQLDGKLTVVADRDIYIVGKDPTDNTITTQLKFNNATNLGGLTYTDSAHIPTSADWSGAQTDDLLGLVASGNIWIMTKNWPKVGGGDYGTNIKCTVPNLNVQAVLFGHGANSTFGVKDYNNVGYQGYLYIKGAVITKYRSATFDGGSGTDYNGYKENNWFDYRLLYQTPPHFLEPTNAGWEIRKWKEIANPL